jgi:hypothetical protein
MWSHGVSGSLCCPGVPLVLEELSMFLRPVGLGADRIERPSHGASSSWMDDPKKQQPPTQRTPTGLEIPLPKRKEVMDVFRKIARVPKKP